MIILFGASGTLGQSLMNELSQNKIKFGITTNTRDAETKKYVKKNNLNPEFILKCDVTKKNEIKKIFNYVKKLEIQVSGIINNFAFTYYSKAKKNKLFNEEKIRKKIFDVNYFGVANILEYIVYEKSKTISKKISVVNILSNSIRTLNASNEHYISSKAAIEQLSKFYAYHYGSRLTVNCVAPGLMNSDLTINRFKKIEKVIVSKTPIKKLIMPSEIASLVTTILLKYKNLNGQTIYFDGGRTII